MDKNHCDRSGIEPKLENDEHPEILKMDLEAQSWLEFRRMCLKQHKHGWWRNAPNPYAVKIDKDQK